jgi:hypothetical protein
VESYRSVASVSGDRLPVSCHGPRPGEENSTSEDAGASPVGKNRIADYGLRRYGCCGEAVFHGVHSHRVVAGNSVITEKITLRK